MWFFSRFDNYSRNECSHEKKNALEMMQLKNAIKMSQIKSPDPSNWKKSHRKLHKAYS